MVAPALHDLSNDGEIKCCGRMHISGIQVRIPRVGVAATRSIVCARVVLRTGAEIPLRQIRRFSPDFPSVLVAWPQGSWLLLAREGQNDSQNLGEEPCELPEFCLLPL